MTPKLSLGMSWAHIKVVGECVQQRIIDDGDGTTRVFPKAEYWELQCDCGKKFPFWADDWKGKKYIPDCGCGLHALDGAHTVIVLSAKTAFRVKMKNYALEHNITMSRAIVELALKGLGVK